MSEASNCFLASENSKVKCNLAFLIRLFDYIMLRSQSREPLHHFVAENGSHVHAIYNLCSFSSHEPLTMEENRMRIDFLISLILRDNAMTQCATSASYCMRY